MASELRVINRNYAKIAQMGKELERLGLVQIKIERSPRVTHIYQLTSKGKKVAEKLKEAKAIIGEE